MGLVGLEEVKQQVLAIKAKVETCKRQETDLQKERFNIVFQGNPGTGKTTVARIYAEFLYSMGVLKSKMVKETSGAKLAYKGPAGIKRIIRKIVDRAKGGVLFVDEAYQLTAPYASVGGPQVLDIILTEMENNIGKLVVIFVGYNKEMESFFEHNPGLASRVPYTLQFTDFEDVELWNILSDNIGKKYGGQMKIEGGLDGLYMRVAIRRLARGRGIRGFGNARSVDNLLARISERQAKRLTKQSKDGLNPDYFLFIKEDLIGPDPSEAASSSAAWAELQELIGLDAVKASAKGMIDMIETNYRRELAERNPLNFSLNRVFFGSPGTGKTTVAKLYGQIMADLGLLSNGEVVVKNPSDFIGKCLGKSEAQTRAILGATLGKVLIIDEAYMLNSGGPEKQNDAYKTAVIDTLVAEVQSVPGDDRCILLLGYEDKLKEMFQNVNPGLSRRFAIDDPFRFEDFNLPQLEKILELKMRQQDLTATEQAKVVALEVLDRARMRPNYSNGGEVDTCLAKAKFNYQTRQSTKPVSEREFDAVLEPVDFDPNFDRNATALSNCRKRLENMVSNDIIEKLEDIQALSLGAKSHGLDPREHVPTKFVFKGPPGTGKTTTARNMGSVYYDMGFLSTDEVIECSASDLIGQFVGHTGPKTKVQLEKALGKVLFIDEAYRLAEGQYATEAVNELIYLLTTPRYEGKMVVILAGYTLDMNNLMTTRPGLSGLFPEEIVFENIKPHDCMILLDRELSQKQINAPYLKDTSNPDYLNLFRLVKMLSLFPSWSNARDIKTLAKQMTASAFREMHRTRTTAVKPIVFPGKEVPLPAEQAVLCIKRMIATQYDRCSNKEGKSGKFSPMAVDQAASQSMQCAQDSAHEHHYDTLTQSSEASAHCTPHHTESSSDAITEMDASPQSVPLMSGAATKQQVDKNQEKERRTQEKLRQMDVCPQGFTWNKVTGGYRCGGGTHFVSDAQLE
ncbi:P-loop containing nucleoside triphosphate hydrolase protein [Wilcoxina mikolae CBS 423.85]|nr:P-loop containing nucleoside triphosphate hydrolase protein [Wilcoxina mikolae CBS 423.85]